MLCFDCPRMCGIDRKLYKGICGESNLIRVSKVIENFMWEEPLITGEKGVLAIFLSGCSLRCEFCQNYDISHVGKGKTYTCEEFIEYLEKIDYSKYNSLEFITPTHFSTFLISVLKIFKPPIPVVWNTSGYERVETIKRLLDVVDIFLFDLKYYSSELSYKLSKAGDYFKFASSAIEYVIKNKKDVIENEILKQGVIVRHLVLPGEIEDSFKVLDFLSKIGNPIISLMQQFTPIGKGEKNRKLFPIEFKAVVAHAQKLGLNRGFVQEEGCAEQCFIPKF